MSTTTIEKTPQQTIERLAKRKNGFTSVELAKERGHPGNHCGPFKRSIKAALKKGAIIATTQVRNGKTVYTKNPDAPKKAAKPKKRRAVKKKTAAVKTPVKKAPAKRTARKTNTKNGAPKSVTEIHKALGPNAGKLLGDFFDSLAAICRAID